MNKASSFDDAFLMSTERLGKYNSYFIYMLHAVWHGVIEPDVIAVANGESTSGRLWDCIWMLRNAMVKTNSDLLNYEFIATFNGQSKLVKLKAISGPGDNWEPVITVLMPEED